MQAFNKSRLDSGFRWNDIYVRRQYHQLREMDFWGNIEIEISIENNTNIFDPYFDSDFDPGIDTSEEGTP